MLQNSAGSGTFLPQSGKKIAESKQLFFLFLEEDFQNISLYKNLCVFQDLEVVDAGRFPCANLKTLCKFVIPSVIL